MSHRNSGDGIGDVMVSVVVLISQLFLALLIATCRIVETIFRVSADLLTNLKD